MLWLQLLLFRLFSFLGLEWNERHLLCRVMLVSTNLLVLLVGLAELRLHKAVSGHAAYTTHVIEMLLLLWLYRC